MTVQHYKLILSIPSYWQKFISQEESKQFKFELT